MVTAYLALPHRVQSIDLSTRGSNDKAASASVGLFVFCRVPRFAPPDISYGRNLEFVRRR
jgi:hypothetical protein